jgi:hypothetical protein
MVCVSFREAVFDEQRHDFRVGLNQLRHVGILRSLGNADAPFRIFVPHLDLARVPKQLGE